LSRIVAIPLVRVPLLGALVCRMRQEGIIPPVPENRSELLEEVIHFLLRKGCGEARDGGPIQSGPVDQIGDRVFRMLAELAYETFTGERWTLTGSQLTTALRKIQPGSAALGTDLDLQQALTGRFGLFTRVTEAEYEVLHQSFGEFLCAWHIAHEEGATARRLRGWLERHAGIRLLDPRLHEVWCHLAASLDLLRHEEPAEGATRRSDATPLLDELWAMHRRAAWWRRTWTRREVDDLFDTALCLAGHCLAAVAGPYGTRGERIARRLTRRWRRCMIDLNWEDSPHSLALIGLRNQCVHYFRILLGDGDGLVQKAAAGALRRIGPPAIPRLIELLGDGRVRRRRGPASRPRARRRSDGSGPRRRRSGRPPPAGRRPGAGPRRASGR
jgi:hypothetical protein